MRSISKSATNTSEVSSTGFANTSPPQEGSVSLVLASWKSFVSDVQLLMIQILVTACPDTVFGLCLFFFLSIFLGNNVLKSKSRLSKELHVDTIVGSNQCISSRYSSHLLRYLASSKESLIQHLTFSNTWDRTKLSAKYLPWSKSILFEWPFKIFHCGICASCFIFVGTTLANFVKWSTITRKCSFHA